MNKILELMLSFLEEIGLKYYLEPLNEETFLPGLKLRNGALIIDKDKLLHIGDVLHEAGHLACVPGNIRKEMSGNLEDCDLHRGGEMMAIAWSYAAAVFLNINPEIVFHENGYKGGAKNILQNFDEGHYLGLPLLQWSGMSYDTLNAEKMNIQPFPYMVNWVRKKHNS